MNLKRQLLLVSLLTLVLPWAGCQFIRETESALRAGQQEMLAGTARAIAETLANYPEAFPPASSVDHLVGDQLYAHPLAKEPGIDGYFDDWTVDRDALRTLRGADGPIRFALGIRGAALFLYVDAADDHVVYARPGSAALERGRNHADRVRLVSMSPPYLAQAFVFAAEAPGRIVAYLRDDYGFSPEPRIAAFWQDTPRGYQLEARIPLSLLATNLGLTVDNTASPDEPGVRSSSFAARSPGPLVTVSAELESIARALVQPGMRLIVTDSAGWRLAGIGTPGAARREPGSAGAAWLRIAYEALVESGEEAELAEPDPGGRESQAFIRRALDGEASTSWYRSAQSGRAVVAVAQPVLIDGSVAGAIVLQQGTDAILSLRSQGLARLLNVTLIATLLVAGALLGYATWLSRRIRRLSVAAEAALEKDELRRSLPSALAGDEVGDLSRSFSSVLRQLADYNEYLRSLASRLSHELRTPLAIVTSSLENLEHEPLNEASHGYAARAKDGAERLRRILTAMSEASRVEEIMAQAEPEPFDLLAILEPTIAAYRDVYPGRSFTLDTRLDSAPLTGAPELLVQLLDKLVDNAVDFSAAGDTIRIALDSEDGTVRLAVANPGPELPEKMRSQLFDSLVSVRAGDGRHLGLGLYVARLIAEGHGGTITAANTDDGVEFTVLLPRGNPADGNKRRRNG